MSSQKKIEIPSRLPWAMRPSSGIQSFIELALPGYDARVTEGSEDKRRQGDDLQKHTHYHQDNGAAAPYPKHADLHMPKNGRCQDEQECEGAMAHIGTSNEPSTEENQILAVHLGSLRFSMAPATAAT
mmetsp:Transcript_7538/g.20623  ORF Transcript_7538/g.20623 Transcript_7538/m.20623 type:complete len:128 (-) Transcript_7538:74-457(-)